MRLMIEVEVDGSQAARTVNRSTSCRSAVNCDVDVLDPEMMRRPSDDAATRPQSSIRRGPAHRAIDDDLTITPEHGQGAPDPAV